MAQAFQPVLIERLRQRGKMSNEHANADFRIPLGGGPGGVVRVCIAVGSALAALLVGVFAWSEPLPKLAGFLQLPILAFLVWRTAVPKGLEIHPLRMWFTRRRVESRGREFRARMLLALSGVGAVLGCIYWLVFFLVNSRLPMERVAVWVVALIWLVCFAVSDYSRAAAIRGASLAGRR